VFSSRRTTFQYKIDCFRESANFVIESRWPSISNQDSLAAGSFRSGSVGRHIANRYAFARSGMKVAQSILEQFRAGLAAIAPVRERMRTEIELGDCHSK
jgi:hypothetical protein